MPIYTRAGDKGQTSIVGGRVSKADVKVDAYGTVDEANSMVGVAIASLAEEEKQIKAELEEVQHALFDCGADLSRKAGATDKHPYVVTEEWVIQLEQRIDAYTEEAPALERFILPGGSLASAHLHVARTQVRRAERLVVALSEQESINTHVLTYLNRLSDYLFAVARVINYRLGIADVEYKRGKKVFR